MSSFFTTPVSQRKRKRFEGGTEPSSKKRNTSGGVSTQENGRERKRRDESISGSESDEEDGVTRRAGSDESQDSSESEIEDETGAERRLRLARRYLDNIKGEVQDEVGFDAAEIDKDLIAERLKEDVAETKGRLYRHLADSLSFQSASYTLFRGDEHPTTAVATCSPYAYTVSKDMALIKWRIPERPPQTITRPIEVDTRNPQKKTRPLRRRPEKILYVKGNQNMSQDPSYKGHTDKILTVAASEDGKFVVTGGRDGRLIVWDAKTLSPLRVFHQHRDSVTGLAFRRGTNQLYSSSKDRTVKIWSLDELAYIETLFGHQDEVVDVAALALEHCVSVGARDRTARLWKIVDETQLVFRGGSGEKKSSKNTGGGFSEGSIDRVAMIDEETFVTGSDNGSISLWNIQKKKPVFTLPLAHGCDLPLSPGQVSAEADETDVMIPEPQPRWITALATIPYSDLVVSGSWDGFVRVWKISEDKRKLEAVAALGKKESTPGTMNYQMTLVAAKDPDDPRMPRQQWVKQLQREEVICRGIVNDISIFERGDRGNDGLCIVAAVSSEPRLGRWMKHDGTGNSRCVTPRNGGVVFEVSKPSSRTKSSQGEQQDPGPMIET